MTTGNLNLKAKWGPFSPTYLGISHILDPEQRTMVDIALMTGRKQPATVILPDNIFDYVHEIKTGQCQAIIQAMPENVSADYSSYSLRYFLDSHGDTALAKFQAESDDKLRCEITFCNSSDEEREYFYGIGLSVSDMRKKVRLKKSLETSWVGARDYSEIEAYKKAFEFGCRQCLTRLFSWGVEDELLAEAFGGWFGDRASYQAKLPNSLKNGFVYFRYIKYGTLSQNWELKINGEKTVFSFPQTWEMPGAGWGKACDEYEEWRLLRIPIGCVSETNINIELRSLDDAPGNDQARIWLDGMLFSEGLLPGDTGVENLLSPTHIDEPICESSSLELDDAAEKISKFKIILQDQADRSATVESEGMASMAQSGQGSFLTHLRKQFELPPAKIERDLTMSPWGAVDSEAILIPADSERTVCFTITFDEGTAKSFPLKEAESPIQANGPYGEMITHLSDILLFNINYPLKMSGLPSHYIVPAKYFPIPYSWDGGLSALGTAFIAPDFALEQTNYFMAEEEYDFPLIYVGSPVPTPLYALWEIYQLKNDPKVLSDNYAGAKRLYDFYLGRTPESIVNTNNDGLLSTYTYNYNLGIDDHPIQRWAEKHQITNKGLYSLILIAQVLRLARIMRNIAHLLKLEDDAEQYRCDGELLANIVDGQMWDEESGFYGWLCQTNDGVKPVVLDGCAGDRSACSFLPLFAGQTTHKERLIEHMLNPNRFNTKFGISSVDMSAPYYNPHGYWNGGIWPVMQWYLWRGLLESGEPALAEKVAKTILNTWQECFDKQHYLGEHFMIINAQMNGAPNFGGLSSILIPMYAAYFSKYQITTCYDVIIHNKSVDHQCDTLSFQISTPFLSATSHDVLINMGQSKTQYEFIVNGKLFGESVSDEHGHLSLRLPNSCSLKNKILIKKII
jgi:Mannosylglycerate hydrolase MGH1-like glycoside hydrolase domain